MSFTLPSEGLLVRLMPASESSSSSSSLSSPPPPQPDTTPRMLQITNANPTFVNVNNGKNRFQPSGDTKIYNSSNPEDGFTVWENYLGRPGEMMSESTKNALIGKYVDFNQYGEKWRLVKSGGSRYSRKKSSKRIRSMKKVGSKFRKYSRRK